jgi:hypothetical protein
MPEQIKNFCVKIFRQVVGFFQKDSNNSVNILTKEDADRIVSTRTAAVNIEPKIKQIKRTYAFRAQATYNK